MKTCSPSFAGPARRARGFSLLEIIGALAIIGIMAAVLAPNLVRALDRAQARAEAESLANLGRQLENFVRDTGDLPAHGTATADPRTWAVSLADYAGLNAAELTRNRQSVIRGYLRHTSDNDRAMLISGLRSGLTVPSGTFNDTQFQQIWDTPTGQVPPVSSWATWSTWAGFPDMIIIQRVNVRALRRSHDVVLNNADVLAATASYRVRDLDGSLSSATPVLPATQETETGLRRGQRVELYANPTGTGTPVYTHVVTDHDVSLTYDSGFWR